MGLMNLFSRDWKHYSGKGEAYLRDGRAADARIAFMTALEKLPAELAELRSGLESKLNEASNALALLNIQEAEGCLSAGNVEKALEYASFAATLAEDGTIRQMAEKIQLIPKVENNDQELTVDVTKCSGSCCESGNAGNNAVSGEDSPEDLDFEILVHALPGDLPARYSKMGEKFAEAFLVSRAGNTGKAVTAFENLLREKENDVILYELGLLYHQIGKNDEAERLLRRGLSFGTGNPLIHLALVDLCIAQRRVREAREMLEEMIRQDLMVEHARLVLGDVLAATNELPGALDVLAPLLQSPARKEAAQKIVSLLQHLGRENEAKQVAKQYLKGCC